MEHVIFTTRLLNKRLLNHSNNLHLVLICVFGVYCSLHTVKIPHIYLGKIPFPAVSTYAGVEDLDVKREDDILAPAGEALAGQLIVGRVHVQHLQ